MLHKLMFLLCLAAPASVFAQTSKITEKQDDTQIDYKQRGAPMPKLKMLLYKDSTQKNAAAATTEEQPKKKKKSRHEHAGGSTSILTGDDVDNGANLFVMIFNPTCSHCEEETAMLGRNSDLFKKSKVLLMASPAMMPYVGDFYKRLHINDYPQMAVGVDSSGFVDKLFLYQTLPQINIYNGERKLLKIWAGEVSIDSLKQYIE